MTQTNPPRTITVPEAGRQYFGLSRGASYAAAAAGTIPTIRVGRLLKVPVSAMEQLMESATWRRSQGEVSPEAGRSESRDKSSRGHIAKCRRTSGTSADRDRSLGDREARRPWREANEG